MGIGSDAICLVDVDDEFRISIPALREAIERDRRDGWHPFAIAASAGSVHNGAIDPMEELAAIARDERFWLHVDGAYGAAALFDPNSRDLFRGIERVDSLSLDPHKWLSIPVECGCVLVRDKALLREAFSLVPAYVRTEPGKGIGNLPWFSEYGFQQTRGFRALKLWVTMMNAGRRDWRSRWQARLHWRVTWNGGSRRAAISNCARTENCRSSASVTRRPNLPGISTR